VPLESLPKRFLRPRGDRPVLALGNVSPLPVPPPTRRSTPGIGDKGRTTTGSSAHAEIDRVSPARPAGPHRFLRPRGDRPREWLPVLEPGEVPPPTRRSTRTTHSPVQRRSGSSAHAEIDPIASPVACLPAWFLRPRGDRPLASRIVSITSMVPPPTRRSTHHGQGVGEAS